MQSLVFLTYFFKNKEEKPLEGGGGELPRPPLVKEWLID